MDPVVRIDAALQQALTPTLAAAPAGLAAAIRHAVFPGGARVRPRLCLAVAAAHAGADLELAMAAACAIELMHCASLVHDDLPCFDDAALRRGAPSVQARFGAPLAVLAGDALIVSAFEALAREAPRTPIAARLLLLLAEAAGGARGLIAGQAMECEPRHAASGFSLQRYQRAKTASLFAAASMSGAACAGADPALWRPLGDCLGEAYQVADDIRDVAGTAGETGKTPGRDLALDRPSAVATGGIDAALARLKRLVDEAVAAIAPCDHASELARLIESEHARLVPPSLLARAA